MAESVLETGPTGPTVAEIAIATFVIETYTARVAGRITVPAPDDLSTTTRLPHESRFTS